MKLIINWFEARGLDFFSFMIAFAVLICGLLLTGTVGRLAFGKRSVLGCTVSSSIAILFIYGLTVIFNCAGPEFKPLVSPLPFVTIIGSDIQMMSFEGSFSFICSELLSMVVLALLVNLVDNWLPRGKNLLTWLFFRILTVALGLVVHIGAVYLYRTYAPANILDYVPAIMLGILALLLLTSSLKLIAGVLLVSVNPIIGGLYTFFFANIIGRQVTEAVFTTALIAGLVYLLNYLGIFVITIAQSALIAYIPFVLLLMGLWYFSNKTF